MKRPLLLSILLFYCVIFSSAQIRGITVQGKPANSAINPQIVLPNSQVCNIYSIAYSPDGKLIASGYSTSEIRIWNAKTGVLVNTLYGHADVVWSVAFSPDGKSLVSGSADKTIKCWDVATGTVLRTMTGHSGTVSFVVYSADGVYIASGSADKTIKFWDPVNGRLLQTLTGHKKLIASIAYSHDGKFMASGSWDNTIKIYYAVGGAEIMSLGGHEDYVFAVAFSPDGKRIASGSRDRTLRIWDTQTGQEVRRIEGYGDAVWSIAYSPDGACVAGSSADGMVKIWDASSGEELRALKGHVNPVRSLNYSADGKYLSSGDAGGVIKIWDTSTGECLATTVKNKDGEWITWTPEGYLTGSEWALKNLSYSVNGKSYSIAQIIEKVYRPDLVAAKLMGDDIEKEAERSSLSTIIMRGGDMPDVSFAMQRDVESDRDVRVSMRIKNVGGGIGKVLLKLNDRAFLIADGVPCKVGQTMTLEHTVSLRNGENIVAVTAYDSTGMQESANNAQKISWSGKTEKPRLFILAVAANEYLDPSISKLKNCVADANGIIDTFTQYSGDLYTDVFVRTLTDKDVTKENIDELFAEIGKEVKPDDVFVLYLAGHGRTYTDGDYYFIPYDFHYTSDESIPKDGVSKWELIKDMSRISAADMMILLDTCNSGSFVSDPKERRRDYLEAMDKDAIIERFAAKAGYDLLAACSTYQYAMDDYNGHGIFTYHVIEALGGYADLNKDKRVTSTELSYYVITEVPRNSMRKWGYEQDPQRILVNLDFPIVGAKNPKAAQSLKRAMAAPPAAADAPPPPIAPDESANELATATISFDDFAIRLAPTGYGAEFKKLDPAADGKACYGVGFTPPLKLGFTSPYADSLDGPADENIADGETKTIDIPAGTILLPWIPSESSVTIGGAAAYRLENQSANASAFQSKPLPAGAYSIAISGAAIYAGRVNVVAGASATPDGYADEIKAGLAARHDADKARIKKKYAIATTLSAIIGVSSAASGVFCYAFGKEAYEWYQSATNAAAAQTYRAVAETDSRLFFLSTALAIGGTGGAIAAILSKRNEIKKLDDRLSKDLNDQIQAMTKSSLGNE
jgi:WD40 repeat protein